MRLSLLRKQSAPSRHRMASQRSNAEPTTRLNSSFYACSESRSAAFTNGQCITNKSLRRHRAARLYRRSPFLQIAAHELFEIFGRATLARWDIETEAFEAVMDFRHVQNIARRLRQLAYDRLGCVLGEKEGVPAI